MLLLACIVGGIMIARKKIELYGTTWNITWWFPPFMMFAGIYGFFTRRNLLAMLISVELILNSGRHQLRRIQPIPLPQELEGFFSPCSPSA